LALVRRGLLPILIALVALAAAPAAGAQAPPSVNAEAYLVADGATGEVLLGSDPEDRLAIASITKLMTAIVVLEHARPEELVTIGMPATGIGESTVHLVPGEKLTVRDLLAAALIQSANDAAWALAAHVGGKGRVPAFVRLMNEKADELGLEETHFVRPDGLDVPGHLSSAEDVLTLAREAMKRPLVRQLVRRDGGTIAGGRDLFAWNDLLGEYDGTIGVKTGHTDDAGWCQVAAARRGGLTMYAVVLGAPTRAGRNADLEELLDWGFARYTRASLVTEGREYATAAVPFREDERLRLVAEEPVERVVRKGRTFVERVVAPAMVDLPVRKGDRLGEVVVLDGDQVVARSALVAAEDVDEPGFGERAGWYAGHALAEAGDTLESVFGGIL
jgi:D-alanyl-D-alanine carboxypeptidase (penicillin-binding protein 5/6)